MKRALRILTLLLLCVAATANASFAFTITATETEGETGACNLNCSEMGLHRQDTVVFTYSGSSQSRTEHVEDSGQCCGY